MLSTWPFAAGAAFLVSLSVVLVKARRARIADIGATDRVGASADPPEVRANPLRREKTALGDERHALIVIIPPNAGRDQVPKAVADRRPTGAVPTLD